jgi:hypothetical protein
MRPCAPTLIVMRFGTSTWEDLGLAAYNTVVRALPESACFLYSPCAFKKTCSALGARQKQTETETETSDYSHAARSAVVLELVNQQKDFLKHVEKNKIHAAQPHIHLT